MNSKANETKTKPFKSMSTENLYTEVRRQELLKLINQDGQATVSDLSTLFGVSEVTIRMDLNVLAERNLIIRTHGGAVPANRVPELSLRLRQKQHVLEKDRIGAAAAQRISNGESIFLDTSSTALAISRYLKRHRELTVITNSLAVAQTLVDAPWVNIVMPGGTVQQDTLSLTGLEGLEVLKRYNIQKGFFGAHGISDPEGLTDVSASEAEVKQKMVQRCREVYAVLDATKWGRIGLASFAHLQDLDAIITDCQPPTGLCKRAGELGIEVISV
jgi:DeoR/GlpR family transcriptional regulator of sugar metabolism